LGLHDLALGVAGERDRVDIVFSRQGRAGTRTITLTRNHGNTVCTVGRFTGNEYRP
jgi:hypothetical protein